LPNVRTPQLSQLRGRIPTAAGLFQSVDLGAVGMIQRGQDPGFPFEPGYTQGIPSKCLEQDLECDIAVQLGVMGTVNLTHPAFTELGFDSVMGNCRPNQPAPPSYVFNGSQQR